MKKTIKFPTLLCLALALSLAACNPQNDPEPQPQPQPQPEKPSLAGTSWMSNVENDYTYYYSGYGIQMLCSQLSILDFNDDTDGEIYVEVAVEVPAMPAASQSYSYTDAFTYTFDGTTLTLTSLDEGAEPGDDGILTFHPADTTFTMPLDEPEAVEMLGVDTLVFHLIQGSMK